MKDEQNDLNEPENSRIFVLYDKNHPIPEVEFKEMFGNFGTVRNIYIVKDRNNDSVKGVAYIKYSKASEAFKAIEAMNGHKIESSNRRMKVLMATSPGHIRNNSEIEYNRLFVFVPKTDKETDLENIFSQYGEVSKVHIVTNKETGESKGIAFITFTKPSSAALAIEECGPNYKAVFAKPKHDDGPSVYPQSYSRHIDSKNPTSSYALLAPPSHTRHDEPSVLTAYTSPIVTYNELYKIMNIAPELELVKELPRQQVYDKKVFQVIYNTTAAAEHAVNRINGFEYPPGHPIILEFSSSTLSISSAVDPLVANKISKDIEVLSSTVTRALAVIKNASATTASFALADDFTSPLAAKRGNEKVLLPSTDNSYRLFFVCKPVIPPMRLLEDTFKMFKGLRNINVIDGKNYGYVTYDSMESAARAINCLNDHKVYNSRLKVMEAEPREPNRKRMKPDTL
ncbi:RNA-binding protein 45 [Sipha flava]|uniref:RNA-binding protein 45 n=1 Tax=Sipha flava TaxID=143950 RepID=A0A2S2R3F8_9HEMI|nr:RNA-binding protein 45 [Sipha flava]XP_025408460.1 RNA-binding protein 45 [Sipha flava]XP_025408461.1 RNA-binding protein 45 [Sipha flava]